MKKRKINKVLQAELILRGHCAECLHPPGAHQEDCSAYVSSLQMLMDLIDKIEAKHRNKA